MVAPPHTNCVARNDLQAVAKATHQPAQLVGIGNKPAGFCRYTIVAIDKLIKHDLRHRVLVL